MQRPRGNMSLVSSCLVRALCVTSFLASCSARGLVSRKAVTEEWRLFPSNKFARDLVESVPRRKTQQGSFSTAHSPPPSNSPPTTTQPIAASSCNSNRTASVLAGPGCQQSKLSMGFIVGGVLALFVFGTIAMAIIIRWVREPPRGPRSGAENDLLEGGKGFEFDPVRGITVAMPGSGGQITHLAWPPPPGGSLRGGSRALSSIGCTPDSTVHSGAAHSVRGEQALAFLALQQQQRKEEEQQEKLQKAEEE
eukprot:TRINITY_DN5114_c0_g1_i1.p1 TRINITY_DN5114_c0_g1~~TRINITY_DN5114_c0_g1_i1.p1  ORF type:complete len:251 (+),score=38.16 TRINITY_DN5114_c0_g1_i1:455-1207(+)